MFVEENVPAYCTNSISPLQRLFFLLNNCCKSIRQLSQIHAQITTNGFYNHIGANKYTQKSFMLVKLMALYTTLHNFHRARQVFDQVPDPSPPLWNQIIRGCTADGNPRKSIEMFNDMGRSLALPDQHTYSSVFNGCAKGGLVGEGEQIHGKVLRSGFFANVYVRTSLMDFYGKSGGEDGAGKAKQVFDEMGERNVAMWNSLLSLSFRYGDIDGAKRIFEEIPGRNVISWTTMIAGCAKNGRCKEALGIFCEMHDENIEFDQVTLGTVMSACAKIGKLNLGKWIHSYVFESFTYRNKPVRIQLKNTLINMYASCGEIDAAFGIFKRMEQRNIVSWTTMITAFAKHGYGEEAIAVFQWMERAKATDVRPDGITFMGVLCACCLCDYVDEGRRHFKSMTETWGVEPRVEHYGCMVDLLSRAGLLDEALELFKSMPMKPYAAVWASLLGGCMVYKSVELASHISDWLSEELDKVRCDAG